MGEQGAASAHFHDDDEGDSLAGVGLGSVPVLLSSSAPELSGEWHEVHARRKKKEEKEQAARKEKVRFDAQTL
jgi:hypothetical protein